MPVGARDVERALLTRELRRARRRDAIATTVAPAVERAAAISSVSSVSPEYETAKASVRGPTKAGVR